MRIPYVLPFGHILAGEFGMDLAVLFYGVENRSWLGAQGARGPLRRRAEQPPRGRLCESRETQCSVSMCHLCGRQE
jgi:hypothetical protein